MDIDSPQDFHDKHLRSVDELVRCPICCEIMTTATLVVKCLHNFCSICIRRHVESKKQCPICKEGCLENSLVTNKLINQITVHYKKARDNLLILDGQLHSPKPPALPTTNNTLTTVANNTLTTVANNRSFSEPTASTKHDSPQNQTFLSKMFKIRKRGVNGEIKTVGEASCYESVSSSSRVGKEEKCFTETSSSKINVLPSSSSDEQECPVCGCLVPGHKINHHLDMCLNRQAREERESKRPAKKKLPNLVWSISSDKALREYCKKYGLTTGGKKPELIRRLKEYTLRYNSQLDQLKQISDRELALEVEQAERVHLKTPPGVVGTLKTDADRAAYSNKYDDQFVKLVNAARKTQNKGNKSQHTPLTMGGAYEVQTHDEIRIIHEVQSTPNKKCNGSLLEFFKSPSRTGMSSPGRTGMSSPGRTGMSSPGRTSSPLELDSRTSRVTDSQEIQQFSSPATASGRHPGCIVISCGTSPEGPSTSPEGPSSTTTVISPHPTLSSVTTLSPVAAARDFKSAAKLLFGSQPDPVPDFLPDESSGDGDLFRDEDFDNVEEYLDLEEIERSFTQVTKKTEQQKSGLPSSSLTYEPEISFSPSTPTKASPLSHRHTKFKKEQKSNVILDQILGTEDKAYLEQEVSRLYTFHDENTSSVNTPRTSTLDRLLQRSYRSNRTLKQKENTLNDSVAEMLNNLDKSPAAAALGNSPRSTLGNSPRSTSRVSSQKPDVTSQELLNRDTIDSPPNEIPDIDDEDLPEFNSLYDEDLLEVNSLDELPETSPIIETGIRIRKRTSGSRSPFSETTPKRGRIL